MSSRSAGSEAHSCAPVTWRGTGISHDQLVISITTLIGRDTNCIATVQQVSGAPGNGVHRFMLFWRRGKSSITVVLAIIKNVGRGG